jgi:hypothetical protein
MMPPAPPVPPFPMLNVGLVIVGADPEALNNP